MKKHLIALDLDGTLLYDWDSIKDETITYLKKIKALGHTFVIATGRPSRSSLKFYEMLELESPLINYNGGLITWPKNPEFETVSVLLDKEAILDIFAKNETHIYNAFCEIGDDIYLLEKRDDIMPLIHFFNGAKLHVGSFAKTLPGDTNGFIIVAHKNQGQYIEQYVKEHYPNKILCRNWGNDYRFILELYTPKTNKGEGLKHVAEMLGFERDDVIAFGDGHNDVEMLEYAKTGVAMKNSHPDLLLVADVISPFKNTENAIERFLEDYFNVPFDVE